jgi:hypothetical protein
MGRTDPDGNGKEPRSRKLIFDMHRPHLKETARVTNLAVAFFALAMTGCSIQSRHTMLVSRHVSKPPDCHIEFYTKGHPSREYERLSRLDTHIERTYYVRSHLEDALPMLRKEACASGADAVIDIEERSSSINLRETSIYHVTATAVRYLP